MAPRYWCKVCAVFVTDTTFERKVHEETAKHKNAWKSHLKGLYETSKEENAKKDDLEREMAEIRRKVAGEGYGKTEEAKSAPDKPAAPKKTFYDKVEEKPREEDKKPVLDSNTGTGVWESVQVLPPAAAPVTDADVSEYVPSAAKRAQKVNDSESTRWKIQEKQLEDDELVLNKKRKLDKEREGIKVELKMEDVKKEVKEEDKEEPKGSMFKRKKKKVKS
ncbi:hypothetical protein CJU89_6033 [Yarrowia sp. B02]|nr:hypothetical protein CJU89_6033 [Yarrowia sp. B02]